MWTRQAMVDTVEGEKILKRSVNVLSSSIRLKIFNFGWKHVLNKGFEFLEILECFTFESHWI
jgi:hypothetical protein